MTREQFHDLAGRVGAYARRHPRRYRLKVALLAVLGYAVVFGLAAVYVGAFVLASYPLTRPWLWAAAAREPRMLVFCVGLCVAFGTFSWTFVRSLFVPMPAPVGRRVQRAEAPALFAVIDEVVRAGETPLPHTVLLTWDFNASVMQRPRFGWVGGTRDFLVLGLPLMAALTPLQFKAVLAHEFAHLRGGHGRFGTWVYRLRVIWSQLLDRLVRRQRRRWSAQLVVWFMRWYAPRFNAYTYALARAQEFEADRWAAQVAGHAAAGEALVRIWVQGARLQEQFWRGLNARAHTESAVPAGVFDHLLDVLGRPWGEGDAADLRRWLRATLGRETDATDTHPSPSQRLAAMGLPTDAETLAADAAPLLAADPPPAPAARVLLGGRLPELLGELEASWRLASNLPWRQRFERARAVRERLAVLSRDATAAPGGDLPEASAWERACLEAELSGRPGEAAGAVARFVERFPQNAGGRLALGRLLLADDDAAGVAHAEEAMRLDHRLSSDGEALLAGYLRRTGQGEQAAVRHRESIRQADVLDAATRERRQITGRDRFLPHGLDAATIADLRGQLAKETRMRKAWLARKDVAHFPERPCYVLVCEFRWKWNEMSNQAKAQEVFNGLHGRLRIAGSQDFYLLVVETRQRGHALARRVRRTAGTAVYPLPKEGGRRWWWPWGGAPAEQRTPAAVPYVY